MDASSEVSAGTGGAAVLVVVGWPGFCLKFTLTPPGLMTGGLAPGAGSLDRTVDFGAAVTAS